MSLPEVVAVMPPRPSQLLFCPPTPPFPRRGLLSPTEPRINKMECPLCPLLCVLKGQGTLPSNFRSWRARPIAFLPSHNLLSGARQRLHGHTNGKIQKPGHPSIKLAAGRGWAPREYPRPRPFQDMDPTRIIREAATCQSVKDASEALMMGSRHPWISIRAACSLSSSEMRSRSTCSIESTSEETPTCKERKRKEKKRKEKEKAGKRGFAGFQILQKECKPASQGQGIKQTVWENGRASHSNIRSAVPPPPPPAHHGGVEVQHPVRNAGHELAVPRLGHVARQEPQKRRQRGRVAPAESAVHAIPRRQLLHHRDDHLCLAGRQRSV
jgi:hypothetical protein